MKKLFITFLCIAGAFCFSSCDISGLLSYLEEQQELNGEQNDEDGDEENNGGEGGVSVSPSISRSEMNEKGYSIKFTYTSVEGYESDNGWFAYTRKGDKYRWDAVYKDHSYIYIYDRDSESAYKFYKWINEDGGSDAGWEDADYWSTNQTITNLFNDLILDGSSLLQYYGFSKTEEQVEILGLPCEVWKGTYSKTDSQMYASTYGAMTSHLGNIGEFYVWNDHTLRTVVNGIVQTECTAIVVGLDDSPFEQTETVTWIQ